MSTGRRSGVGQLQESCCDEGIVVLSRLSTVPTASAVLLGDESLSARTLAGGAMIAVASLLAATGTRDSAG